MRPQFQDKRQIVRRRLITEIIIFVSFFFFIFLGVTLSFSGSILNFIGRPIWATENFVSQKSSDLSNFFHFKSSLITENQSLKMKNTSLKNQMADYQILKKENIELKSLWGRLPKNHHFINANILSKPDRSPYDTIIINVGSDDGVSEELPIYADSTIPLGKISKVYSRTSLVTLYSNPGEITDAIIDGSNTSVSVIGRGGGNFEMIIPKDLIAEKGSIVSLPRTVGIGTEILAIIEDDIQTLNDPSRTILLRSPVNIQELKWVQVEMD